MIKSLNTHNLGLSPEMSVEWASRLNLVTGDNGLGKSFLLHLVWYCLTGTWASLPVTPRRGAKTGEARYALTEAGAIVEHIVRLDVYGSRQPPLSPKTATDCVVTYVRVDGGYSLWDSTRNHWTGMPGRPEAYHFGTDEVWDGLDVNGVRVCEGLERDWISWQKGQDPQFDTLVKVLKALSPPGEPISPAPPQRVFVGEGRDRPTIAMGGQRVALVHASSAIRRVLALAYLIVWNWHEVLAAAEITGESPPGQYIILFDEPEAHLHPRWQRAIIPSLLGVIADLRDPAFTAPQMLVTTHAPLVLASVEPFFDRKLDDLIHLDLRDGEVVLEQGYWSKQGDAANWLVSETFGLEQARSRESEEAIEAAEAFMRGDNDRLPEGLRTKEEIDAALRKLLPDHDKFWPRWLVSSGALDD